MDAGLGHRRWTNSKRGGTILGYATADLILSGECSPDDLPRLERIVAATADALERVLGAPAGCLQHASREGLSQWLVPPSLKTESL